MRHQHKVCNEYEGTQTSSGTSLHVFLSAIPFGLSEVLEEMFAAVSHSDNRVGRSKQIAIALSHHSSELGLLLAGLSSGTLLDSSNILDAEVHKQRGNGLVREC